MLCHPSGVALNGPQRSPVAETGTVPDGLDPEQHRAVSAPLVLAERQQPRVPAGSTGSCQLPAVAPSRGVVNTACDCHWLKPGGLGAAWFLRSP